jgi:hypothetical protein
MDANQAKMKANRKANQDILARIEANRKSNREQMLAKISARMDANTKEMKANTKAIQERMEADRESN